MEINERIESLVRDALQWVVNGWNRFFDVAEEMNIDFYFYVSPLPSTMLTARQPHAADLPLKRFFYCPLRGRRSALASLSLSLAKGRTIKDAPPAQTQQPQPKQINPQKQTNQPHPQKQTHTI